MIPDHNGSQEEHADDAPSQWDRMEHCDLLTGVGDVGQTDLVDQEEPNELQETVVLPSPGHAVPLLLEEKVCR